MTHTYAILVVSKAAFDEIEEKMVEAGYADQLHDESDTLLIDMHGIALQAEEPKARTGEARG